jgi:hypothetical protein
VVAGVLAASKACSTSTTSTALREGAVSARSPEDRKAKTREVGRRRLLVEEEKDSVLKRSFGGGKR